MFSEAYLDIIRYMEMGGNVLWYIAALTCFMWTLIFERIWYFRAEHKKLLFEATSTWENRTERSSWSAHQIREGIISEGAGKIAGSLSIIETCVALCPLFGLLGTVTGMIEVFQVMAFSGGGDARAMAGGVSKATLPTMAGMVVSLSGIFAMIYISSVSERHNGILEERIKRV